MQISYANMKYKRNSNFIFFSDSDFVITRLTTSEMFDIKINKPKVTSFRNYSFPVLVSLLKYFIIFGAISRVCWLVRLSQTSVYFDESQQIVTQCVNPGNRIFNSLVQKANNVWEREYNPISQLKVGEYLFFFLSIKGSFS